MPGEQYRLQPHAHVHCSRTLAARWMMCNYAEPTMAQTVWSMKSFHLSEPRLAQKVYEISFLNRNRRRRCWQRTINVGCGLTVVRAVPRVWLYWPDRAVDEEHPSSLSRDWRRRCMTISFLNRKRRRRCWQRTINVGSGLTAVRRCTRCMAVFEADAEGR